MTVNDYIGTQMNLNREIRLFAAGLPSAEIYTTSKPDPLSYTDDHINYNVSAASIISLALPTVTLQSTAPEEGSGVEALRW